MFKRILLFFGLCLALVPLLRAEELILDSGDTQDWVRIMEQAYPKYKDTMIRPTALLKFQTGEIPAGAKIEYAEVWFRQVSTQSGAVITVSYVSDDSWSYDRTEAEGLYSWPAQSVIGTYITGG